MTKILFLMAGCTALTFGSTITASGDPGNTPNDLFDIAQGTTISANSPVISDVDIRDMFGGTFGTGVEAGDVVFSDTNSNPWPVSENALDYFVTFTTSSPITLGGYSLNLIDDLDDTSNRTVTQFQLFAAGNPTALSDVTILTPSQTDYLSAYGSHEITVSDSFSAVTASTFTAVFTANPNASADGVGPRVVELDGFGGVSAQGGVPEPGSLILLSAGMLGLLAAREWNRLRGIRKQ